jgi:glycosyltransferase involved in cell wall biosynthesis
VSRPAARVVTPIGVIHVIDTLAVGGAEQMAVNLVNLLPRERYRLHLCTTRREGPLAESVRDDVGRLCLGRTHRFDLTATYRLIEYNQRNEIRLLHAHGTAVFLAAAVCLLPPYPSLVWHDHFGRDLAGRRAWQYRPIVKRVKAIVAVSGPLVRWSQERLRIPPEKVSYVPNFVTVATADGPAPTLPGVPGARLVCVANWREQKDHLTLLHAFEFVLQRMPAAHLFLVGAENDGPYGDQIRRELARQALNGSVSVLGSRSDVPAILAECDVGVLSSVSEGLPLALLEYGLAGLPGVATAVGQCPEVLDHGHAGVLVPPGSAKALGAALLELLESPRRRKVLGEAFRRRVQACYSAGRALSEITRIYDAVLAG